MNRITKEKIINDVLEAYPQSLRVFAKYHIDACCGSYVSIEEGAKKVNADLASSLEELNRTAKK